MQSSDGVSVQNIHFKRITSFTTMLRYKVFKFRGCPKESKVTENYFPNFSMRGL